MGGPDTISHQCNRETKYPLAPSKCCGASGNVATMCCKGFVCHKTQFWRCVAEDKAICAGEGTLAKECGSEMHNGAGFCCEGFKCDMESHYCVDKDYTKVM